MRNLGIQKSYKPEDTDSPGIPQANSLFNLKISPFSPSRISELSISEEETSYFLKNPKLKYQQSPKQNIFAFGTDLSSIHSSPQKNFTAHVNELKNQIITLTKKLSNHQREVEKLSVENGVLISRIGKLRAKNPFDSEVVQKNSHCNCSIF